MATSNALRQKGFTLIELMIVVVIIGILAAIAVPKFTEIVNSAKEAEARPVLKQIYTLEERYRAKNDAYTLDITLLEEGSSLATGSEYYSYSVAAHGSGYCAVATPTAAGISAGIDPQSMDAAGTLYENGSCS